MSPKVRFEMVVEPEKKLPSAPRKGARYFQASPDVEARVCPRMWVEERSPPVISRLTKVSAPNRTITGLRTRAVVSRSAVPQECSAERKSAKARPAVNTKGTRDGTKSRA